jgi:thymidine phosphorylase
MQAGQQIDPSVGLAMEKRLGDRLEKGDVLLKILCDDPAKTETARALVLQAVSIGQKPRDRIGLWQEFESKA